MPYYKAVTLNRTSHLDRTVKWRKGFIVKVDNPDPPNKSICGRGIHISRKLLDAVAYQATSSIYAEVSPLQIICEGDDKLRCDGVKVLKWLLPEETDKLAGFKLWEANHPVNPFKIHKNNNLDVVKLVNDWASVRASVWASVWDSVWAYTGGLFTNIISWEYGEKFGDNPWKPLLDLWYGGYIPVTDGKRWYVLAGRKAKIVKTIPGMGS